MDGSRPSGREFLSFVKRESIDSPDLSIVDATEPDLLRDIFPWERPPALVLDGVSVPTEVPAELWITDTTFRDGQQAREPYTQEQMVHLYGLLGRLGGPQRRISMSEFFLYTKKDINTVVECLRRGDGPKVTAWIRATSKDVALFEETSRRIRAETGLELDETGILTSLSDYHVFFKYGRKGRREVLEGYLALVEEVLRAGFACRCHLEDVTRSNVMGVVVPFVRRLMRLAETHGRPVVIRIPDTVGVGVPWDVAALPRSIPKLVYLLRHVCGVPAEWLEFHGHQDLGLGIANATAAWMYGAARNNGTLLGVGERAGNIPLETLVFAYGGFRGRFDGMDTRVITEIVEYYEKALGHRNPDFAPITGRNFAMTRAGVHADGTLKNVEMYLPFDVEALLGVAPRAGVTPYSGTAGIAFWLQATYGSSGRSFSKDDALVRRIHESVEGIFACGRTTSLSDREMEALVMRLGGPESGVTASAAASAVPVEADEGRG
ncbi:MAG: 2-isopropylmalate synthase [Euryarchaeota archaeon RBG_16_68_13]|nr:MAG: 2-isopropylmalate synthase [Euryarchaeota archaeon RBG_16_68_13]